MKVLLIEDDVDVQACLRECLEPEGYIIDTAQSGNEGSYAARINTYDLIIIDLIITTHDGSLLAREIRGAGVESPIILLTTTASVDEKVMMFNCGIDDFMLKPFVLRELLARMRSLLRRPKRIESTLFHVAELVIDTSTQRVYRDKTPIYLTRKEFSLLECLVKNRGHVVTRGMIMENVWHADTDPFSNTIEAHMLNLRRKISCTPENRIIITVPGRGYRIDKLHHEQYKLTTRIH
jgi:two-component system OmpR family response regulator